MLLYLTTTSRVQDPTTASQTEIPLSKSKESLFEVWGFLYNILTFKELSLTNFRSPSMADLKPSSAPSEDKGMILWTTHCFAQVIRCWGTLMHLCHFQYPSTTVLQDLTMNLVMLQTCCNYIQLEIWHMKNLPPQLFWVFLNAPIYARHSQKSAWLQRQLFGEVDALELFWSGRKRDDGYSIHRGKLYPSKRNFTTRNMAGTSQIHHLCSK